MQTDTIKTVAIIYPTTTNGESTGPTKPSNVSSDDYDPHLNRNVKNPTTNWQTFAHFLKASVGTGVLAMPSAFSHAGYVNGTILTLIIGLLALYCLHILVGKPFVEISCMYILCKRQKVPYVSFSEAMNLGLKQGPPWLRCLAPIAIPFVDGFLAFYHFGICCVYVVFIAESIKQLVDEYLVVWDVRLHMCLLIVPLLLIYSIKNLQVLAPFSSAANLLLLVGFGIILYYIFEDLPPLSERDAFVSYTELPTFFGTVLFALEAVGVATQLRQNMATPGDFVTALWHHELGHVHCPRSVCTLGILLAIGNMAIDALGSITLKYSTVGYTRSGGEDLLCYYHLDIVVPCRAMSLAHILAIIVLLTFACAIAIPDLSVFLSLVGSFCLSILGLIFPALLQICVQYEHGYGPLRIKLIINILLLCFGVFGGVVGTYVSILEIIAVYK
ncbi:GL22912 [Drosophila persimilis]|uniref:GL22912 n=1 Tax=Drosophila persimilis TaxID=7234 RepID=B4H045_DROPE|nr:GL22912 [Drosophila persimilis]